MTDTDRLVETLPERLAEHSTIPVPVETIACNEGWTVVRERHQDQRALCSGFAVLHGDQRIIGINRRISPRRQRYAVAHSLAHGLLHLKEKRSIILCYSLLLNQPASSKSYASGVEEAQARDFAMALLMPERQLLAALRSEAPHVTSRDQLIERLAKQFEVSNEAMGYRLIDLGVIAA
jgi:Zn-dependent peptidase ImmA (M78 family)